MSDILLGEIQKLRKNVSINRVLSDEHAHQILRSNIMDTHSHHIRKMLTNIVNSKYEGEYVLNKVTVHLLLLILKNVGSAKTARKRFITLSVRRPQPHNKNL